MWTLACCSRWRCITASPGPRRPAKTVGESGTGSLILRHYARCGQTIDPAQRELRPGHFLSTRLSPYARILNTYVQGDFDESRSNERTCANSSRTKASLCGIVMPISEIDGCSESHWKDVRSILSDVIHQPVYAESVKRSESIGLILKDIVTNLYTNPIVVVDVSARTQT